MDAVGALMLLGGVASVDRILRHVSRKQLRTATSRGRVLRLRRGVYGLPDADRALTRAAELGGMCSHLSAAVQYGWEVAHRPDRP